MSEESKQMKDFKDRIVLPIGGIFFLLQFVLFMFNYNFYGLVLLTWLGWFQIVPGFLLITISESTWRTLKETDTLEMLKTRVSSITPHPIFDGWLLLSLALTLISQHWLTFLYMCVQIPLIIFSIYHD